MPANGKVVGKLVAQLDLQTAGFMKSTTGVNKAIRQIRSNLRTLDKFYKANGDEMNRLNSKYKQSKVLMETYREKLNGLRKELNGLKPNTQAFIKQQSQIRRTEADMKQLEAEMKSYRKQMLYVNSSISQANAKYKAHRAVLEANRKMAEAQGNAEKKLRYDKKLMAAQIQRNNEILKGERVILGRIRSTLGITSNEYKEQAAKVKQLKAENVGLTASMKSVNRQMLAYRASQKNMNKGLGRSFQFMKQNKAGLIDVRNSLMGLTAAATGVAYPIARAMGGAVKATVSYQDALANVRKTIDPAKENIHELDGAIRNMAKTMPQSHEEIANTMSMAAQLGVHGTKHLKEFTRIATEMGVATDMSSTEAATALQRFANATGKPDSDFRKLGSTVVNLGNNTAATESQIMNFSRRLAGAGGTVKMSQPNIMALGDAMASVGINAEAGGSAMSKVLHKMNNAVQDGGEKLQGFAKVAGVSGEEFAETWKKDPYQAVQQFEAGLDRQNKAGGDVKGTLEKLGITELRETDTVLRLANGHKQMAEAREYANDGYKKGTALSAEAEQKYKTLGNQMKIFMNHVKELGISLGSALAPALIGIMKVLTPFITALTKAPTPVKAFVAALALIPVVAVPVLGAAAAITGAMGLVGQSMLVAEKAAMSSSRGLKFFVATQNLLLHPVRTTTQMLQNLATTFRRTGKASKAMAVETITSEKAVEASSVGMSRVAKNSNKASKSMQGAGAAMAATGKKASLTSRLFGVLKKVVAPLVGLGGLLTAAFEALAAAIGLLLTPIGAIVAAVAAVGVAFVVAYKKVKWFRDGINGLVYVLKVFVGGIVKGTINAIKSLGHWFGWLGGTVVSKSTSAIKSWYKSLPQDSDVKQQVKAIQSIGTGFKNVMRTLGTATHKATDVSNVLGKGVSKGTKQALSKFVDYSQKSDKLLAQIKNNHGKITTEEKDKLIQIQQDTTKNLMSEFKKRAQRQLQIERDVFAKNSGLSEKREQAILQRTEQRFSNSKKKLKEINKEIQNLVNKQARDGKLSGKEMKRLNQLYDEQRKLAVGTLSKTDKEQQRILSRMSANREAYNIKEAQSIVKEAIKARDNAKKENKKRYDQEVDHINSMTDLSKTEKEKMLKDADDRYRKANKKADDNHKKVLDGVKKSNEDIETEMDLSNGKVYSNAEKWWKKTKKGFGNFFDDIGKSFSDMGKSWKKNWDEMISDISNVDWSGMWDGIKKTGSNIGGWFSEKGQEFAKTFKNGWDSTVSGLGSLWSGIKNTGAGIGEWFSEKGRQWYGNFKNSWETTKHTAGDLWQGLKNSNLGQWFAEKGQQWYTGFKNSWETTKQTAGDLWSGIKGTGASLGIWFAQKGQQWWSTFKNGWEVAKQTAGDLWSGIKSTGAGLGSWFAQKGASLWSNLKKGWNTAVQTAGSLWNGLTTALGNTWGGVKQWFINKGSAMMSGIIIGWNSLKSTAINVFTIIWKTVKRIWSGMTGTIRYWSGVIWARVKTVFGWIRDKIGGSLGAAWKTIRNIWKGMYGTIKYWTGIIWGRIKSVFSWIKDRIVWAFRTAWNIAKRIWKGIYGTIKYWTGIIWSRIKAVFGWIKKHISWSLSIAWKTVKHIWKGIYGTIKYWTGVIWSRIKSIFNSIKKHIGWALNIAWKTIRRIWKGIFGTIKYWSSAIWNKIKNTWTNIKNKIGHMAQGAWDAVKSKFKGMYNSAKYWVDQIGSYISNAKKWMKKKAASLGKSVANGAIWGLNKMIGGINAISKAITSKKLMKKIPTLSTGTTKGKPKSNRKGQLRKPTPAIVNDKGRGNGKGRNGHQEIIRRRNGDLLAPQGKNVLVNLNKGDTVYNGAETQSMQNNGIIPHFAAGTKKKKKLLNAVGEQFTKFVGKAKTTGKHAGDVIGDKVKGVASGVKKGVQSGVHKAGEAAGEAADSAGDVAESVMGGIKGVVKNVEDWMDKPKALVDLVMKKFGVFFGKGKNATIDMAKGAYAKLKASLVDKVKEWFEDSFGGGGGYNPYAKNSNFTFVRGWTPGGHAGIDYGAPTGTPIPSPIDGKVIQSWFSPNQPSGGNETQIWDGHKYTHIFMHQSKRKVKTGDRVHQGQIIGLVGNTGNSFGSHLHWQVNKGKGYLNNHPDSINPLTWAKQATKAGGGVGGSGSAAARRAILRAQSILGGRYKSSYITTQMMRVAKRESNFQSDAVNNWDINAQRGTPSKGMFQMIEPSFRAFAMRGHGNILNPVDEAISAMKYIVAKYGWGGFKRAGDYAYANGGLVTQHQVAEIGEGNKPEMVIPLTKKARAMQLIEQAKSFMGIEDEHVEYNSDGDNSGLVGLLQQNNALLNKLIEVVISKELNIDRKSLTNAVNKDLGNEYKSRSYARGGY